MTHRNRRGRLERAAQLYNERQAARIVPLLCSMTARAVQDRDAAAHKQIAVLRQLLLQHGINNAQVGCLGGARLWVRLASRAQQAAAANRHAGVQMLMA